MPRLLDARNPVAFFANGIGDNFLSLPAIRALARLFPRKLTLLCGPEPYKGFYSDLSLRRLIETSTVAHNIPGGHVASVAKLISSADLFLSLAPWHSRSLTLLLQHLPAAHSVGFFTEYDVALPLDYTKHAADLAFDVPKYLSPSLRFAEHARPPSLPRPSRLKARRVLSLLPPGARVLAVHADTDYSKQWPARRFGAVLNVFLRRHPEFYVLVVGSRYEPVDQGKCSHRIIPCHGLPLAASMSLVAHSDMFLGVDSSMLHVADSFRVPGVGLFGPTNSREFGFRLAPHRHVCGQGAMSSIQVREVTEALEAVFANFVEPRPPARASTPSGAASKELGLENW